MKKGDIKVEPLVVVAIVIFFIAISLFAYMLVYKQELNFFLFPSFNITKEKQTSIEIIRYDMTSSPSQPILQYYNGNEWNSFAYKEVGGKKIIDFGKKQLDMDDYVNRIGNYYFFNPSRAASVLDLLFIRLPSINNRYYPWKKEGFRIF